MSEPDLGAPAPQSVQLQFGGSESPSFLDYLLILGSLGLVGYGMHGLMDGHISSDALPIIASLLSFITGTVLGGYAGYRWGSSVSAKRADKAPGQ